MKIPDPIYDQYYFSSPENQEAILRIVENLLKEERNTLLDRAWEYVVKASREECGSRVDFIKFVNEHE